VKCVSASRDHTCALFLALSENDCSHTYVLLNITHIRTNSQQFWGFDPWGGKSKQFVHHPHKAFIRVFSRVVYLLIAFEVPYSSYGILMVYAIQASL
jgi:hypothetical protein